MYVLANRDLELSCDETVVRSLGEELKSSYAKSLISLEEKKGSLTPLCNSFSKNAIEERIVSIMKIKKTSLTGIIMAFILVTGVTTAFATSKLSSNNNLIQQSTKVTAKISNHIDGILKSHNINVESITPSHDAITEGMDTNWDAYNLVSTEGNKYLLIVRSDGEDYTALLDSENNLMDGLIDNGVLPKYFELYPTTNQPELFRGGDSVDKAIEANGMVAAIGINDTEGWVYARELDSYPAPNTPEEALSIQSQNELDYPAGIKYINLYDKDGTTIIGKFEIEVGANNVVYKDSSLNE